MKKLQTTLISTLIALSLMAVANAETATIVFIDKNGKAKFTASDSSVKETNAALGLENEVENDATTLVIEEGKRPVWTIEPLADIDKRYGGNGSPTIVLMTNKSNKPVPTEPKKQNKPIPPEQEEEKKEKPNEKFDESTAAMQPEDGTWQLTVISNTYDAGCPTDPFPPASIAGMTRPVDIKWGTPWKPTAFFEHYPNSAEFSYEQLSPTQWNVSGVPFKLPKSSAAAAPSMKVLIEEGFTLINPRELKVNATLTMKMSVRGMNLIDCKGHLKMLAKHIKGPKIKIN